jgi:hypothetical protein
VFQAGQRQLQGARHGLVVETTKHLGHDQHLGFAVRQHEAELALAQDVQRWFLCGCLSISPTTRARKAVP